MKDFSTRDMSLGPKFYFLCSFNTLRTSEKWTRSLQGTVKTTEFLLLCMSLVRRVQISGINGSLHNLS